jgi:hypothetical protein
MPLNRRLTVFLAFCFALLLLFLILVNAARREGIRAAATAAFTAASPQSGLLFPDVEPISITRITVREPATGRQITVRKVPGDWVATDAQGTPTPVDLPRISQVVQILGTLRYNRVIIDQNLTAYGLVGEGRLNVQFALGAAPDHLLRVGELAQVSGQTFVQRDSDSAIYLVSTQTLDLVSGLLAGPPP